MPDLFPAILLRNAAAHVADNQPAAEWGMESAQPFLTGLLETAEQVTEDPGLTRDLPWPRALIG